MGLRAKSTFRLLMLAGGVTSVLVGGYGFYWYNRNKRAKQEAALREMGMREAKEEETVAVVHHLGPYLMYDGNDVEALKVYTQARMQLPDKGVEYLRDAMGRYRQLISLVGEPENLVFRRELLKIYGMLSMGTEGVQTADILLKRDPKDVDALIRKAGALLLLRKTDEALKCAQEAMSLEPLSPVGSEMMLNIMKDRGAKSEELIKWAQGQVKGSEGKPEAQFLMAKAYLFAGDHAGAASAALKASEGKPASAELARGVALMLETTEHFPEALAYLGKWSAELGDQGVTDEYFRHLIYAQRYADVLKMPTGKELARESTVQLGMRAIALCEDGASDTEKRAGNKDIMALMAALAERANRWDFAAEDWQKVLTLVYLTKQPRQRQIMDASVDAAQRSPKEPFFRYYMGNAYFNAGDMSAAGAQWKAAETRALSWARPLMQLSQLFEGGNDPAPALAMARAADGRLPGQREVMVAIARTWAEALNNGVKIDGAGSADELLAYIENVQKKFTNEETTLPLQVELLVRMERKDQAIALMNKVLAQGDGGGVPPNEATLLTMSAVSARLGLGLEEKCLDLSETLHGMSPYLAEGRCRLLVRHEKIDEAKKYLDEQRTKALAQGKDVDMDAWGIAWCTLLEMTGDTTSAGAWKTLAELPTAKEDPRVLWDVLAAGSVRGDHAFIGTILERLKALNGDTGLQWRLEECRWLLEDKGARKDQEEAMKMLQDSVRLWPNASSVHALLAAAYENAGDVQTANKEITTASDLDSQNAPLKMQAAQMLLRHNDKVLAAQYLRALVELPATTDSMKLQAGVLLAQTGDVELSQKLLASTAGNNAQAQLVLASLYWQTGRIKDATDAFNKALEKPTAAAISQAASFFLANRQLDDADRVIGMLAKVKTEPGEKEFFEGAYQSQRGDTKTGIDLLRKSTAAAPNNANAWRWLIATLLRVDQENDAITAAATARTAMPDDPTIKALTRSSSSVERLVASGEGRGFVISCLLMPNQNKGIQEIATAYGETDPAMLADAVSKVADQYKDSLPVQIFAIRIKREAARLYAEKNQNDQATKMLNDALALSKRAQITNSDSPMPALYTCLCCAALHRWNEALQAAQIWRANSKTDTALPDMAMARLFIELNRGGEAEGLLEELVKKADPGVVEYRMLVAMLAQAKLEQGHTDDAAALLWPLAEKYPDMLQAWSQLAWAEVPEGAAAKAWLAKAEGIVKAEDYATRMTVGMAYYQAGVKFKDEPSKQHGQEMMQSAVTAKQAPPEQQGAMALVVGQVFEASNDQANAEKYYRLSLADDPHNDTAANNLAMVLARGGDKLDEALLIIRQAVALRKLPDYYDTLSFVLIKMKQYDEAQKALQSAIELDPSNPLWLINSADLMVTAGKKDEARAMLDKVDAMHLDMTKLTGEIKARYDAVKAEVGKIPK